MSNAATTQTLTNGMKFTLDFNALTIYEDITGKNALMTIASVASGFGAMRATDMRAMFYAGLKRHNPEVTIEEAGDLVPDNMDVFVGAISDGTETEEASAEKPKAAPKRTRKASR